MGNPFGGLSHALFSAHSFQKLLDVVVQDYPGVDVWAHVGDQLGDAWP